MTTEIELRYNLNICFTQQPSSADWKIGRICRLRSIGIQERRGISVEWELLQIKKIPDEREKPVEYPSLSKDIDKSGEALNSGGCLVSR